MTTCKNCGARQGCGKPDCDGTEQPSCRFAPEHCCECPPWRCKDCGEMSSATSLCKCWTTFDGMALADVRGLFAASGFDTSVPYPANPAS